MGEGLASAAGPWSPWSGFGFPGLASGRGYPGLSLRHGTLALLELGPQPLKPPQKQADLVPGIGSRRTSEGLLDAICG